MRRITLVLVALAVSGPTAAADQPANPPRPNIVIVLADDQGWGDLSLNGNANLRTPHIDSLAKDGARFERFFVQPVCSPTRAEFLIQDPSRSSAGSWATASLSCRPDRSVSRCQ
ncbi:MAG TPA: sulfatase-like hydrolase/transferase [Gemmataceae bacterium]|nr:sulfatase-like hydrolase/transferase [Gemmataceae bacterium]